jgi:uncharacterized protein YgbK (DUF1537 family)
MTRRWGVVADDVTGATDIAGMIAAEGVATTLILGEPDASTSVPTTAECIVVALKTRTAPRTQAVGESVRSARWLLDRGADLIYQKYCSTFDSTDEGMIGPIAEGLAELLEGRGSAPVTSVGTPSSPALGRTVYNGHLFVGTQLLSESPLRDHPLTPMRDSDLVAVLGRQTTRPVDLVALPAITRGVDAVAEAIRARREGGARHLIVDALTDADLDIAAEALDLVGTPLAGGGSGLGAAIARRRRGAGTEFAPAAAVGGERLILAGSCSSATLEQIAAFDGTALHLDVHSLAEAPGATVAALVEQLRQEFERHPGRPVLAFSSAGPADVAESQRLLGRDRAASLVESAWGRVARLAVQQLGVRQLVIAGGETAGAVTAALGIQELTMGAQVDPGVSWTRAEGATPLALLLKSGNFGRTRLFTEAWEVAS